MRSAILPPRSGRARVPVGPLLLSALLAAPPVASGQLETYHETVERLVRRALSEGRAYTRLAELVDVAPHRLSGSPGAAAAVEWARQTMEREGLQNVRLEPVTVPHWVRGEVAELRVSGPPALAGAPLSIVALGGSVGTPPSGVTGRVLEVTSFNEVARLGERARGAILFYNRPMDASLLDPFDAYRGAVSQRTRGAIEAARVGAAAVIVRSMTTRRDDVPHTGGMRYEDGVPRIPAAAVSTLGADWLSARLAAGHEVELTLRLDCETLTDEPSFNVVGELVGSERPDEIVVVGGHLDAWDVGQGAHDDGAGCCQSIEAVRLIRELGLRPRRTIRVVLFMNEENGLRGGRAYRADHADELDRHVLALESDSGGFVPRGFTTNANPEAFAILESIVGLLEPAGAGTLWPGGGGADISPMAPHGVVLVGLKPDPQRYFDLHHSHSDVLSAVSDRELNLGAGVMAALLYVVADLPEPLPRNPVPDDASR